MFNYSGVLLMVATRRSRRRIESDRHHQACQERLTPVRNHSCYLPGLKDQRARIRHCLKQAPFGAEYLGYALRRNMDLFAIFCLLRSLGD